MKRCDEELFLCARSIAARFNSRSDRMSALVDLLWDANFREGLSWVGFYLIDESESTVGRLVLGPRRDKPACSPIGMHGACGACVTAKRPIVVANVLELGANYIACDPLDQSELVVPCFDDAGNVWGVIDLDSHFVGYFTEWSAADIERCVTEAGISSTRGPLAFSHGCV